MQLAARIANYKKHSAKLLSEMQVKKYRILKKRKKSFGVLNREKSYMKETLQRLHGEERTLAWSLS